MLNEILEKDPNYKEARELLGIIERNDTAKMIADFKAKFNKNEDTETKKDETDK